MSAQEKRSEVWHEIIQSFREGSTTEEEIVKRSDASIHRVRRVLREMENMGWVTWPGVIGTVYPGPVAGENLRGIYVYILRERVYPDGEWGAPGHHDAPPDNYVQEQEAEIEVPLDYSHRIIWDAPDDRLLHYGDYVELTERGVIDPIPDDEWH